MTPSMEFARHIADAALYEGYLSAPHGAPAAKNRAWRFGVLVPAGYTTTAEPSASVTECLLEAGPHAQLRLRLRFLHLRTRTVERAEGGRFRPVPELTVDGTTYTGFDEATACETEAVLCLADLLGTGRRSEVPAAAPSASRAGTRATEHPSRPPEYAGGAAAGVGALDRRSAVTGPVDVRSDREVTEPGDRPGAGGAPRRAHPAAPAARRPDAGAGAERTIMVGVPGEWSAETIEDANGELRGRVVLEDLSLRAAIRVRATRLPGPCRLVRLRVTVANTCGWADAAAPREQALRRSLLATHLLIGVSGGAFLSPTDPPEWAAAATRECRNQHTWPVLVGPQGSRDVLLSAPIALYDRPEIGRAIETRPT